MNLTGFWAWLKPFLVDGINFANAELLAAKPELVAQVNALATKDVPSVAALIESKLNFPGLFGAEIKALVVGYLTTELPNLTADFESADGKWFDELYTLLTKEETDIGL